MKKKIVVVEEINDIPNVADYLVKSGEYVFVAINTIIECHTIADHRPDVVVLNDTLAGGSSQQLCALLKKAPRTSQLPPILLSTRDSALDLNCAVDDVLVKPFNPEQLLAKIASWVARPKVSAL